MNNQLAIAEHSLNAKLWSEYHFQVMDTLDAMRDLGWDKFMASKLHTDAYNSMYVHCQDIFSVWMRTNDTCPKFGMIDDTSKVHYIAMAGLKGCLPNYCASHDTYESAVDDLGSTHTLETWKIKQLRKDGYLELRLHRDGNEYCEITSCDCDDPDQHNDN